MGHGAENALQKYMFVAPPPLPTPLHLARLTLVASRSRRADRRAGLVKAGAGGRETKRRFLISK